MAAVAHIATAGLPSQITQKLFQSQREAAGDWSAASHSHQGTCYSSNSSGGGSKGRSSKQQQKPVCDRSSPSVRAMSKYPRTGKRGAPQAFARKLYEILLNESPAVIAWSESGDSFFIHDIDEFVNNVLLKYFRRTGLLKL